MLELEDNFRKLGGDGAALFWWRLWKKAAVVEGKSSNDHHHTNKGSGCLMMDCREEGRLTLECL